MFHLLPARRAFPPSLMHQLAYAVADVVADVVGAAALIGVDVVVVTVIAAKITVAVHAVTDVYAFVVVVTDPVMLLLLLILLMPLIILLLLHQFQQVPFPISYSKAPHQ